MKLDTKTKIIIGVVIIVICCISSSISMLMTPKKKTTVQVGGVPIKSRCDDTFGRPRGCSCLSDKQCKKKCRTGKCT